MKQEMINRINELARIKRQTGLTPEQAQEQKELYRQYLDFIKQGVKAALDDAQARTGSCSCGDSSCKHKH